MNAQYLKQIFSQQQFLEGYHKFLENITKVIEEDNEGKIHYLSETIEKMITKNEVDVMMVLFQGVQKIKRLPWTIAILNRTEEIARGLL